MNSTSSNTILEGNGNNSLTQDPYKLKRLRQNVALQSIYKKIEENKQVFFFSMKSLPLRIMFLVDFKFEKIKNSVKFCFYLTFKFFLTFSIFRAFFYVKNFSSFFFLG